MSKLKVGDIVFYKGDEGIIREVMMDGKENFYRVDVSKKSIHYLYEDELDLGTQKLNDNQKVVLEYLKDKYQETKGEAFWTFWTFKNNSVLSWRREQQLYAAYIKMSGEQQFEILEAFAQWGMEQEAVNEK